MATAETRYEQRAQIKFPQLRMPVRIERMFDSCSNILQIPILQKDSIVIVSSKIHDSVKGLGFKHPPANPSNQLRLHYYRSRLGDPKERYNLGPPRSACSSVSCCNVNQSLSSPFFHTHTQNKISNQRYHGVDHIFPAVLIVRGLQGFDRVGLKA